MVNLKLFIDYNGDGWISVGDVTFFNGKVNTLPSSFELDEPMAAGSTLHIGAILDWWSTPDDNQAQSDSMVIDITFELGQTAGE